jgi:3-oxoacyl-[acyl-carrier-protein] synthase-3
MKAFIKGISYYLPETVLSNDDLIKEFPEWTVDKIASKIGIHNRHIASQNETAADMAVKAGEKLFIEYKILPSEIDFILLCTQSPDYYLPTSACIIQEKLGVSTKSGALDFNLGCSGFVYGLALAKGLIISGIAKNIMLLTSETYTKHIHQKDKGNRTIFGDAAAATLISTNGIAEILNFSLGTDGRGAENLIVRSGGFRNKSNFKNERFDEDGNILSDDNLFMNGAEIFNFTLENVPLLTDDTLAKNNLKKEEISLYVFHQANRHLMNFLRKKIGIEESKFYYYLENVGNTVSSTIPIALKEAINDKSVSQDSNVLIAGFGVGYSWGGTILKF